MIRIAPCLEPKLAPNTLEVAPVLTTNELSLVNMNKERVALFVNDWDLSNILKNLSIIPDLAFYLSLAHKCGVDPQNTSVYVEDHLKDLRILSLRREKFNVRSSWTPKSRDIIWMNHDPQVGREMKGRHPFLVLSPRRFNQIEGIVCGLPMTTAPYNASHPFAIAVDRIANKTSYVLCHRLGSYDWQKRDAKPHHLGKLPDNLFSKINDRLGQIKIFSDLNDESSQGIQDRMMRDMRSKADSFDVAILVGGDNDFCLVVKQLQRMGKCVVVVGLNSMTSLKNTADHFIDLEDIFFREAS